MSAILAPHAWRHRSGLKRFHATGEGPVLNTRIEITALHRDGREFPVEVTITALRWEDSYIFCAFVHDITGRKQAEKALRERTFQLESANKELESFSYSVSHDLRAPLRSIDGFSVLLLEEHADRLDPAAQGYLRRVRAGSQRMGQLIDDLLNLSRVTRSEMNRETVDLSALARAIATELQQAQPERAVDLVIAPNLVANGDARLLRIALENLLSNAWKFTGRCSCARIEFGAIRHNGQPAYLVRDNGAGFDMTYAHKLFGAFQRLHAASEFPGSGIGLATVQRIIHRHGGRVWTEGEVERGATFYFTLA